MTYCRHYDRYAFVYPDSRTNAGVDNVSTYSKMHLFGELMKTNRPVCGQLRPTA